MKKQVFISLMMLSVLSTHAQQRSYRQVLQTTDSAFFATDEARRIGDQLLLYQRVTGGWPKNIDMVKPLTDEERQTVLAEKNRRNDSTTDNKATITQIPFLARLYNQTGEERYKEAFVRGMEYLLSGQYDNGGWPQFWPENRDYQVHITYNDNAMVNVLKILRDARKHVSPYTANLVDDNLQQRCAKAFDKGIECILNTQIVVDGEPTVWCQQHDRQRVRPSPSCSCRCQSPTSVSSGPSTEP